MTEVVQYGSAAFYPYVLLEAETIWRIDDVNNETKGRGRYYELYYANSAFKVFQDRSRIPAHTIELAAPAIFGHNSAHSLATGPVIAEPFISPLLLTMTPALSTQIKRN